MVLMCFLAMDLKGASSKRDFLGKIWVSFFGQRYFQPCKVVIINTYKPHEQINHSVKHIQKILSLMEVNIISYSSPSCLTTLNYQRSALALTRKHSKRCKQGLSVSVSPSFMIVSKFNDSQMKPRRSANYHPSIWDNKLIESFTTPYSVSTINIVTVLLYYIL